jgi:hypothetical protein
VFSCAPNPLDACRVSSTVFQTITLRHATSGCENPNPGLHGSYSRIFGKTSVACVTPRSMRLWLARREVNRFGFPNQFGN